jgi:acyl carrier protein
MSREQILAKVLELIAGVVGKEETANFNDTTNITENADSLDVVEIVMEVEGEFDLKIEDAEAQKIKTVGDLVDFVVKETSK